MSYILDALRKADRERQRGTVPTLQGEPVRAVAPSQHTYALYVLLAAVLLAAGVGIGWWQPWREAPLAQVAAAPAVPAPASLAPAPVAVLAPLPAPTLPAPTLAPVPALPPALPPMPVQASAPSAPTPAALPAPAAPLPAKPMAPPASPPPSSPPVIGNITEAPAPLAEVIALEDLPPAVRQELPAVTVQLHAYSSVAKERLVSINDKLLREGDRLSPALRLEQITKDGMIFSYKGYRFRRGVQQ